MAKMSFQTYTSDMWQVFNEYLLTEEHVGTACGKEITEETMNAVSWGEDTKTGVKGWFEKEEKIEKRKEYYKKKKAGGEGNV